MIDAAIALSFSLGLAALFAATAAHKLRRPQEFFATVTAYELAPAVFSPFLGAAAIAMEVLIAAGLLLPATRQEAALAAAGLLFVYGAAIGVNILRGRTEIDCGCSFGKSGRGGLTPWLLLRNGLLAAAGLAAAAPVAERALGWFDAGTILLFVVGALTLYAAFDALMSAAVRS